MKLVTTNVTRRFLAVVSLCAMFIGSTRAAVPVVYPKPVLTEVAINLGAEDQTDPHVSGDWAVYNSGSGLQTSIRYYRFSTGVDAAIPMGASARDTLPDLSSSRIVFSRTIAGVGTGIMVFDAATSGPAVEIDPVASGARTRLGSAIGGDTVAYIDFGLHPNGELVIHDLATSTSVRITTDTAVDQNPSVSPAGDVVVWEHCANSSGNCDIWQAVKTGATWTVSATQASSNSEADPDTNGTVIVYDSVRGGSSDIFWRLVAGGPEMRLELAGVERAPSIAGDFIAFEGQADLFAATDIFVYDLVNNRLFQITDTPLVNEQLNDISVLPDGKIRTVWASDEDGFDQRNIRSATFELPNVAPTLAFSAEAGYGTDGVGPDSGSRITFFTYKVVYADFEDQAPSFVDACIDGTCRRMTVDTTAASSLQDGDYKNGEQYSYTTKLASGVHAYFFEASDGTAPVRLPALDTLAGPSVSDLRIITGALPDATVGVPYSVTQTATGGTPPYTWELSVTRNPPPFPFDITGATISGTASAAGSYGIGAVVTDAAGDSDFAFFSLTVNPAPSTPPVLNVPATVTVNATSPAGTVVTYVVTATDAVDPNPVVACAPASGTTFAIGTTLVSCTATNAAGSQSSASFNVVVKGAPGQITDLIALVMSFNLKQGIENSLDAKLQNVLDALNAVGGGNTAAACNKLTSFINEVLAQSGKAISTDQAAQLIAAANQAKAVLGCP